MSEWTRFQFSEVMNESGCVCANVYSNVSETKNKVSSLSRIGGRLLSLQTSVGVSVRLCTAPSQQAGAPAGRGGATYVMVHHRKPLRGAGDFFFLTAHGAPHVCGAPPQIWRPGQPVRPCPEPPLNTPHTHSHETHIISRTTKSVAVPQPTC